MVCPITSGGHNISYLLSNFLPVQTIISSVVEIKIVLATFDSLYVIVLNSWIEKQFYIRQSQWPTNLTWFKEMLLNRKVKPEAFTTN